MRSHVVCSRAFLLSAALFGTLLLSPHFAVACDRDAEGRITFLENQLRRADADIALERQRVAHQDQRIAQLPDDLRGEVPEAPAVPIRTIGDAEGRLALDCTDLQAAKERLIEAELETTEYQKATTAFVEQIEEREFSILAAEDEASIREMKEPIAITPSELVQPPTPVDPLPTEDPILEPLLASDSDVLYQRILTLPDARLSASPGGPSTGETLPPFTVFYVFEERPVGGEDWVRVGAKFRGPALGWLPRSLSQRWNTMLVMQFADRGRRERVLFFENETSLIDQVTSPYFAQQARALYSNLEAGEPLPSAVVAAEPSTAVRYGVEPYLLPILDFRRELFDTGEPTVLVNVASVSLTGGPRTLRDQKSLSDDGNGARDLTDFSAGVVFVIDTTKSMQPYIDLTYQAINRFYQAFDGENLPVSYGLVAFRDSIEHDRRLEYVTEIIQPLVKQASTAELLTNLRRAQAAQRSTIDWREDAYAGIREALEELQWSDFSARVIVLISDASAREAGDKRARYSDLSGLELSQMAQQKGVALVAVHLQTAEAVDNGDVARATSQYTQLTQQTGDSNQVKYLALSTRSEAEFGRQVDDMARAIASSMRRTVGDAALALPATPSVEEGDANDGDVISGDLPQDQFGNSDLGGGSLGDIIRNEILRAQLEYLGDRDPASAPKFLAAWASDRDLINPNYQAMRVSVFLTRNQLNALAQSVAQIVDAFKAAELDSGAFFDNLQLLAATTAQDPNSVRNDERLAIRTILPSYIDSLPYRSEVLRLDRAFWDSLSTAQRQSFVDALESKLRSYRRLADQPQNWVDFGAGDRAQESYPVPLDLMP